MSEAKWTDAEYGALMNKLAELNASVAAWRHNYRTTLQAMHDENNALRATAATLSAKLAAKEAPRTLLEKFFKRRSEE